MCPVRLIFHAWTIFLYNSIPQKKIYAFGSSMILHTTSQALYYLPKIVTRRARRGRGVNAQAFSFPLASAVQVLKLDFRVLCQGPLDVGYLDIKCGNKFSRWILMVHLFNEIIAFFYCHLMFTTSNVVFCWNWCLKYEIGNQKEVHVVFIVVKYWDLQMQTISIFVGHGQRGLGNPFTRKGKIHHNKIQVWKHNGR